MQKPSLTAKEASQGTLRFTYVTFMLTLYHKSQQHFVYILKIHSLQTKLHSKYTPFMVSIFHLNFPSIITLMLARYNSRKSWFQMLQHSFSFFGLSSFFILQYFLNSVNSKSQLEGEYPNSVDMQKWQYYKRYESSFSIS